MVALLQLRSMMRFHSTTTTTEQTKQRTCIISVSSWMLIWALMNQSAPIQMQWQPNLIVREQNKQPKCQLSKKLVARMAPENPA